MKSGTIRKTFSILLISLFLFPAFFQSANAVDNGSLGAFPTTYDESNPNTKSWFIYTLGASETKKDSVTVENTSDQVMNAKVYAVDATITNDGAFALLQQSEEKKDVGSWIKLSQSEVSLKPGEKKEIPFTVTVPKYVAIGDHAGGIVIEDTTPKTQQQQGLSVNLVSRIGVRIYDTVPGEQDPKLNINDFTVDTSKDKLSFKLKIENTGNVFLYPKGTIDVTDQFNNKLASISLDALGTQIPGKETEFNYDTNISRPVWSNINAHLSLNYSSNKTVEKDLNFTYSNQNMLIIIGVAILLVIIILILILRKVLKKGKKGRSAKH